APKLAGPDRLSELIDDRLKCPGSPHGTERTDVHAKYRIREAVSRCYVGIAGGAVSSYATSPASAPSSSSFAFSALIFSTPASSRGSEISSFSTSSNALLPRSLYAWLSSRFV